MEKGKMIFVKKVVGFTLAISVINYFYTLIPINEYLHLIAMALAAYFLIKSGAQL